MILTTVHFLAALVVLAEALNKLERGDLFHGRGDFLHRLLGLRWLLMPWRWRREHVVMALKLTGWSLLAIAAGGALMGPFFALPRPQLPEVAMLAGFAVLIVRSRIKEG